MQAHSANERFNILLNRMADGGAPSAKKKTSGDRASDAERDACSSDTQARPEPRYMSQGDNHLAYSRWPSGVMSRPSPAHSACSGKSISSTDLPVVRPLISSQNSSAA